MTLFLIGLLSLLSQVVLLRELNVAFYGIELVYLVALAAWLAGTAAGAAIVLPGRRRASTCSWLLAAACLLLPLEIALVRGSRLLFGGVPGAYLPLERQLLVLLMTVCPMAVLFGLAFRRAAASAVAEGGTLGAAYAVESLGAAVGGLAATIAFRFGLSTLAVAVASSAAVLFALAASVPRRRPARLAAIAGVCLAALLCAARTADWDFRMTRWTHPSLVESRDTPYGRLSVTTAGGQLSVFQNDVLTFESETTASEELGHLAALQHPAPARMLLLGGAIDRVDAVLRRHHPASLDHVEMDPAVVAVAQRHAPTSGGREESGTSIRIDDPRAFVRGGRHRQAEGGGRNGRPTYDLIVIALAEPVSGQTNRFYTREFFEQCAARLAPGGVLGFRLNVPENYLAPAAVLRASSVARALADVFPFVELLPATSTIVVASRSPLPGPAELIARAQARGLDARLVTARYIQYLYANDRRGELRRTLLRAHVRPNTDSRPVCYFFASLDWLSMFVPRLIGSDPGGAWAVQGPTGGWRLAILVGVAAFFAACRLRPGTRRAALAFSAGFVGMMLENVVFLDYQAKHGALFEDLGTLVMAFMVGSALGAWTIARRLPAWTTRPSPPPSAAGALRGLLLPARRSTALLLAALSSTGLLCAWVVVSRADVALLGASMLLAATGALVAAVFTAASATMDTGDGREIGRLYAADLLGGCLGGLAGSLVLVPLAGLDATALLASLLGALALFAA